MLEAALDDISDLEAGARQAYLDERLTREAETPFDLSDGPLLRATLVKLDCRASSGYLYGSPHRCGRLE